MRHVQAAFVITNFLALCFAALVMPHAHAAPASAAKFHSRADITEWIDSYREKPEPARVPSAVRALSKMGALRDPEAAGFYVGFVAGVLGANSRQAEHLIEKMLPLPASDQWLVVRAVAYSGLPAWKSLLARIASKLPARRTMIDEYLIGKLPPLNAIELDKSPTFLENVGAQFGIKPNTPAVSYGRNPELLDTLWGVYFANGAQRPIWRIVTMLPWSQDRDSLERLTTGSAAKYTLANNAARYPDVMALIKKMVPSQDETTRAILTEVIHAAETVQTAGIRKAQLAALEKLKVKGPGYQRDMKLWGYVGQGAIAAGCVAAAVVSLTVLGLPCVVGGAVASSALNYWAAQ